MKPVTPKRSEGPGGAGGAQNDATAPPARPDPSLPLGVTERRRAALARGERAGATYTLVPPRTMLAGAGGVRVGRRAGGSLEFRDYRDYQPGDDLRHLDWNVLARSDRLAVKQFQEEISPYLDLVIDGSRSMSMGEKPEAALALAALFAAAARTAGMPYALWVARERVDAHARGADRPSEWADVAFDHRGSPANALQAAAFRPMSMRIVISDLLWPGEPQQVAASLAHGASAVVIVQVLGRDDAAPDVRGGWTLLDSETGAVREVYFDAQAAAQYRTALARHRELWDEAARHARAALVRCVAEEVGENLVFDELAHADVLRAAWFRS